MTKDRPRQSVYKTSASKDNCSHPSFEFRPAKCKEVCACERHRGVPSVWIAGGLSNYILGGVSHILYLYDLHHNFGPAPTVKMFNSG